jgi:hypothetical protein
MLVVEILVLALIAYEVFGSSAARRNISKIADLAREAQQLHRSLPAIDDLDGQTIWVEKATNWIGRTRNVIRKCPPYAARLFETVRGHVEPNQPYPDSFKAVYRAFSSHSMNLQQIREDLFFLSH